MSQTSPEPPSAADIARDPPWEPPIAGDEVASLLGSLERQRATFAWKCSGLDADGLRATVGASTMTLGGMLKHVAVLEDIDFSVRFGGANPATWWDTREWEDDPDWEWRTAADHSPQELEAMWREAVDRSRAVVVELLTDGDLDQRATHTEWDEPPSLRRVLVDLIEEYARHVGHADLLRESVDGLTGEDPPRDG